ncbi:hypothetical protein GCM10011579_094960 [Streptomyces albiflavescens]|uniref:SseB protein N-terminal domain-containing protein n=1 Tax=Streptomyces albiflavescens TaxID=1623582 RepID=A0A917YFI4_9ACTN|nr:type VII secretion system-associated protein [Streptomyces albiflavescens]GGN94918.1 hypothetical protein GCM10011579_094960 [Streptomyces albiflavescens]
MSEEASANASANEQGGSHPLPPLTEEMRTRARQSPGSWLYSIDPAYDAEGAVPPYAILGAWPVDEHGEPGVFMPNPDYRPSPRSLLLADPTDPVDAAMQRAATGHGLEAAVLNALREATVYLPVDAQGELTAYQDESGSTFVKVLTDPRHGPPTAPQLLPVALADLLTLLPDGTAIRINADSEVSLIVENTDLRAALQSPDPGDRNADALPGYAGGDIPTPPPSAPAAPEIPRKGRDRG